MDVFGNGCAYRDRGVGVRRVIELPLGFFFFKILYVCVYMCTSALGGQKRHQIPLEAELQEALNFLPWVLATELSSFARTGNALYPLSRLSSLTELNTKRTRDEKEGL